MRTRILTGGLFAGLMASLVLATGCDDRREARKEGIVLVEDGRARAVVVTAAEPSPVAEYAVREWVEHVEKVTGVVLPVVRETDDLSGHEIRIYVGMTEAARQQGIDAGNLGPDEFILRAAGTEIFVIGKEDPEADPLDELNPNSGTLFGVYELLEQDLGVHWLWPGELGTVVPSSDIVRVSERDETIEPRLRFRRYRWRGIQRALQEYRPEIERLAFSREGLENYAGDLRVFLRRHRLGYSEPKPPVGHYFGGWWRRYGSEHPDWFMMLPEGRRATPDDDARFQRFGIPMCVSNPELHRYIVEEVYDGGPFLRLGEVDVGAYCHCPDCMAWDGPQPTDDPDPRRRIVSDRYARFWKTIQAMASEKNPDVLVTSFLYMNYFHSPLSDITLNSNIYGEFVPWGPPISVWYPATEERLEWQRKHWLGWSRTGIRMGYRPNHTLAGYAMPHINTWQGGEFFRWAYENGMIGVDFDSLIGQWAVRGPEHYMYFRLFSDPTRTIESIRGEYFSGFGPAAEYVEQYFDYWEAHNHRLLDEGRWINMYRTPRYAPRQYPPEVFPPAEAVLDAALTAAEADPTSEYARRVRYLQVGLEHARLSVELMRVLDGADLSDPETRAAAKTALQDVASFRRKHEDLHIADFSRLAFREMDSRQPHAARIEELFDSMEADPAASD